MVRVSTTTTAPHEPSAWLRGRIARRLRRIDALGLDTTGATVVAPLVRGGLLGEPSDRTCDRCRAYTAEGSDYFPFPITARRNVPLIAGLCSPCHEREFGGAR